MCARARVCVVGRRFDYVIVSFIRRPEKVLCVRCYARAFVYPPQLSLNLLVRFQATRHHACVMICNATASKWVVCSEAAAAIGRRRPA